MPRLRVALLIAAAVAGAGTAIGLNAGDIGSALSDQLGRSLTFLAAAVLLQLFALKVPGRGSVGVSAVALVGAAISLGAGPAMAIGVIVAAAQWLRSRGKAHRALFDGANIALASWAAAVAFDGFSDAGDSGVVRLLAAVAAGLAYTLVNHGLLCLAMAASESRSPLQVWHERFHWARFHFLAFGVLGLLAATADASLGAVALVAFVAPPILLALSMREALARLRPQAA